MGVDVTASDYGDDSGDDDDDGDVDDDDDGGGSGSGGYDDDLNPVGYGCSLREQIQNSKFKIQNDSNHVSNGSLLSLMIVLSCFFIFRTPLLIRGGRGS